MRFRENTRPKIRGANQAAKQMNPVTLKLPRMTLKLSGDIPEMFHFTKVKSLPKDRYF